MTKAIKLLPLLTILFSCDNQSSPVENAHDGPVDTSNAYIVEKFWVRPKSAFELHSIPQHHLDTLHLVSCADFVYFPFGKLTDSASLSSSLIKEFKITSFKRDTFTNTNVHPAMQWNETLYLTLNKNRLQLFLDNDPEASTHGYIQTGQIVDDKVTLVNNIRVGMGAGEFYGQFFEKFPADLINKYKVVKLESCVLDITHVYHFSDGRLKSIQFLPE